jgi:hypothetical protein
MLGKNAEHMESKKKTITIEIFVGLKITNVNCIGKY